MYPNWNNAPGGAPSNGSNGLEHSFSNLNVGYPPAPQPTAGWINAPAAPGPSYPSMSGSQPSFPPSGPAPPAPSHPEPHAQHAPRFDAFSTHAPPAPPSAFGAPGSYSAPSAVPSGNPFTDAPSGAPGIASGYDGNGTYASYHAPAPAPYPPTHPQPANAPSPYPPAATQHGSYSAGAPAPSPYPPAANQHGSYSAGAAAPSPYPPPGPPPSAYPAAPEQPAAYPQPGAPPSAYSTPGAPPSAYPTPGGPYPGSTPAHAALGGAGGPPAAFHASASLPPTSLGGQAQQAPGRWLLAPPLPQAPALPPTGFLGPFVRFNDYNPGTGKYALSVLVITHPSLQRGPMQLFYGVNAAASTSAPSQLLDEVLGFKFWRFDICLVLQPTPGVCRYSVVVGSASTPAASAEVQLPARDEEWRWVAFSCNGFHDRDVERKYGGITYLWKDLMARHASRRFHLQVGGGDQIYCDAIFELPALQPWLGVVDPHVRGEAEFTASMLAQSEQFYLGHYWGHFSEPTYAAGMASIPFAYTWDDHDIFDGWGSYPDYLQHSPVFQGLYSVACRFYLLFQQHATPSNADTISNTIGGRRAYHQVRSLGPSQLLLMPDCRAERSTHTVVPKPAWDAVFAEAGRRLDAGRGAVRHVIVLLTVPIVYPSIPFAHKALAGLSGIVSGKSGGCKFVRHTFASISGVLPAGVMSQFNEPELLDDLRDHWTAAEHTVEKEALVRRLQALAATYRVRVTFVSGDVHLGAFGCFQGHPKIMNRCADPKFMLQVVTSAIGNEPPPAGVVKTLEMSSVASTNMQDTMDKMIKTFPGKTKLRGQRNYCEVVPLTQPVVDSITGLTQPPGGLMFNLWLEVGLPGQPSGVESFHQVAPLLLSPEQAHAQQGAGGGSTGAGVSGGGAPSGVKKATQQFANWISRA